MLSLFNVVLDGMKKSREKFESNPDKGIFCDRLWNIFEVYILRFLVGIIVCFILFPLVIIINSVVSLLLSFTAIIWNPILLVLVYVY